MNHVLTVLGLLAAYAVFVAVKPDHACRWCAGWGAKGRRRSYCARCKGTGKRFLPGARAVHWCAATAYRYFREWMEARGQ